MYRIYQVDAFTDTLFKGNPAAVCPLEKWLPDELMQNIAAENNLAETAFFTGSNGNYHIRWFTPEVEVDLCGHATLAAAHVIFKYFDDTLEELSFDSRSGILRVRKKGEWLSLNFPTDRIKPASSSAELERALGGIRCDRIFRGKTDIMVVLDSQKEIEALKPEFGLLSRMDIRGLIVTAKGETVDFVSRFFAPRVGINEDPVTGSAHTTLVPYWSERMGLKDLTALQLSKRGGYLKCRNLGDRVEISGMARTYLAGEILLAAADTGNLAKQ